MDMMRDSSMNNELKDNRTEEGKLENRIVDNNKQKEKRMKNDLTGSSPHFESLGLSQIAELSKYRIERLKTQNWATKDIKFLVYDDTDVSIDGYDSDDEETMLALAIKNSYNGGEEIRESGIECTHSRSPATSGSTGKQRPREREGFTCHVCSSYPEFPHKWKPRKFRVVCPAVDHPELLSGEDIKSVDICMHYVAVSYCWPSPDCKPTSLGYQVRDLDGSLRPNRAPDDVIDRAVNFANSCSLRMIWIDQECLPQSTENRSFEADWNEQELGIQFMDIMYNRALVTADLLGVGITEQEQLNAIEALLYADQETRHRAINPLFN